MLLDGATATEVLALATTDVSASVKSAATAAAAAVPEGIRKLQITDARLREQDFLELVLGLFLKDMNKRSKSGKRMCQRETSNARTESKVSC